jgi:hypothetical protein
MIRSLPIKGGDVTRWGGWELVVEIYDSSFLFGKSRNQPLRVLLLALDPSSSKLLCLPSLLGAGLTGPGISSKGDVYLDSQ